MCSDKTQELGIASNSSDFTLVTHFICALIKHEILAQFATKIDSDMLNSNIERKTCLGPNLSALLLI